MGQGFPRQLFAFNRIYHHDVEVIAKPLGVIDTFCFIQKIFGPAQVGCAHHQSFQPEMVAQLTRRARLMDPSFMNQGDAGAALGFVKVRRGDHDRDSLGRKLRQRVPKLPARNRINTGSWFIKQQNLRFDD